jgi:predicted amino acid dehydrogenase
MAMEKHRYSSQERALQSLFIVCTLATVAAIGGFMAVLGHNLNIDIATAVLLITIAITYTITYLTYTIYIEDLSEKIAKTED